MAFSPILVSNLIIYWATNLSIVPFLTEKNKIWALDRMTYLAAVMKDSSAGAGDEGGAGGLQRSRRLIGAGACRGADA
jgi:hypothetical protein